MTAISQTIRGWGVQLPLPKVFDVTVYYEPSAHFRFTRKIRNDFEELARDHAQSTWLLGSHGGKARMQTDIQGIGLATRLEVGRLSLREGKRQTAKAKRLELIFSSLASPAPSASFTLNNSLPLFLIIR